MHNPPPIRILLVDDDEGKRYTVGRILRKATFDVVEAATGADALRLLADRPDLVILDVKLPDISGFEVCRRIKADPETTSIPVLHLSTTFVDIEDKVHGLEGGADGYLTDVLEPLELIATIRALLRARKAEEAAELTARQWQVTFDAISDGVLLLDPNDRVVQVNQSMERILGMPWNEIAGRTFQEIFSVPPDWESSPSWRLSETRGGESAELARGDRWLRVSVDPVHGGAGVAKGALCIISDVTERRRLEEELRRRADELAAADLRKDEFLAMLAHELRNPLAPIRNSLEAIRTANGEGVDIAETVEVADRQVRHMARLLDDLLDVARFTKGKIQLRKGPVDLAAVAAHAADTARSLIESSRHELSLKLPPRPILLEGDPTRLEQVVANLLNNAAKYTEPGGRIILSVAVEGPEAILRVQDTGVGLSAEMLSRVFDLFSQADISLDRAQGGLGIGLTLVRSLVELHGGTVTAHSGGLGHGSEFVVRLPLPQHASSETTEPARPAEATSTSRRVLVVDDHRDSALSLAKVLQIWGHLVTAVHDGPAAIAACSADSFDVVLLDIGLPGMDGFEVAETLLRDAKSPVPILVALTGYGQDADQRRSQRAGFDVHLVKPVNFDDLRAILTNLEAIARNRASKVEV